MSLFDNIANAVAQQVSPVVSTALNVIAGGASASSSGPDTGKQLKLMGGISMARAKQIFEMSRDTDYAKKNLWYISIANVTPLNLPFESISSLAGDAQDLAGQLSAGSMFSIDTIANMASQAVPYLNWGKFDFNLFATEVSYSPVTLNGNSTHAGGAAFNQLEGRELVEMRITTLDDSSGSIKNWFRKKSQVMVMPGGALGLPITYLLKIRVTHAFPEEDAMGASAAYYDEFVMRPANIDTDLSRREDNLQELHMTFQQFDNFTQLV